MTAPGMNSEEIERLVEAMARAMFDLQHANTFKGSGENAERWTWDDFPCAEVEPRSHYLAKARAALSAAAKALGLTESALVELPAAYTIVNTRLLKFKDGHAELLAERNSLLDRLAFLERRCGELEEALKIAQVYGLASRAFDSGVAIRMSDWIEAGRSGPPPELPPYLKAVSLEAALGADAKE